MPKQLPWVCLMANRPKPELDAYLDVSKTMVFRTSNRMACTLCPSASEAHTMQYQLAWCNSSTCSDLHSLGKCVWRGKVEYCSEALRATVYELGQHLSPVMSPRTNVFNRSMRFYAREMAKQEMKPARIRNNLIEALNLDSSTAPKLVDVQNCVANYRRHHMSNTDLIETLDELALRFLLDSSTADNDPIAIGFDRNARSLPILGDGTNNDPFVFGITTIDLVRLLNQDPESFVFHLDATFKLNQCSYPVIVCGITAKDRSFRPVAFFVVSQRTSPIFVRVLQSLCRLFQQVVGRQLQIKYVMGDADDAQFNAVHDTLGRNFVVVYLMCFYHVVAKVSERVRGMSRPVRKQVFEHVYDMHFARSQASLETAFAKAWSVWVDSPETLRFAKYFHRQWLSGKFLRWQCYHTPTGFAKTNNPVEQFNKIIKRDYTLRVRLKVGMLIEKLASCIKKYSKLDDKPAVGQEQKKLKRRMQLMVKANKLRQTPLDRVQISALVEDHDPSDVVRVVSVEFAPKKDYDELTSSEKARLKATMSWSNSRMEWLHMPVHGWVVDPAAAVCGCGYFFKYSICVHLLFALTKTGRPMPWESGKRKRLKNRTIGKRKRDTEDDEDDDVVQPGRPPAIGFALSFD